ncbi:hypothetical protein RHMOL_Rhmol01G0241100 [Rhododendron molle]|uniref:Uncharacterized protein n=1 Tax=Rhododendron molle TaxID=49168 RepID=A0ACC0Q7Z4_RHOML|nr:hypothetical protein RHMOL_Rhmol01G0241100 [Rhododendron molle]
MSILCGFGVKAVGWPPLHFTRTHTLLNNQSRQPTPLAVISTSLSLSPLCFLRPSSFPSLVINPSLGSKKQKIPPSTLFSLCPFLPPMASATKIIQPPSFNFTPNPTATRSPIISLFDPLKTHHHHHKLRLNKPNSARRSTPIAAVSNAVKVKKSQTTASLPNPLITKEEGLELYEDMILGRYFEDMCAQMYYRGKMFGFVHLYNGQEAVSTGFIKLLKQQDSVVSTYRDHVHALSKGVPARAVMSELFGRTTGCCRGQGGSMHMFSKEHNLLGGFAFIGEGIPVATGAAFTSKYRREVLKEADCDHVTVAFFGDGTANNGQFFECLNMAALWKLPIVFVVENNLWAIGMSHLRATSVPEIWKKGPAFGMPGVHVDGMDVLKVREVAMEAITRARRGEGPTLVECETYRFRGHSLADPDELRDP